MQGLTCSLAESCFIMMAEWASSSLAVAASFPRFSKSILLYALFTAFESAFLDSPNTC